LKAIENVLPVHKAQLLTYLRLSDKQVGLLINFNAPVLKHGIYRCISTQNGSGEAAVKPSAENAEENRDTKAQRMPQAKATPF
jgi:hypothetical protein